jgi:hypothetical protein
MKNKAIRIAVLSVWAVVCIALVFLLVGYFNTDGFRGGFQVNGWNVRTGIRVGSELIYQESAASSGVERLEITASSDSVRVFAVDGGEFAIRQYGPTDMLEEELVQIRREDGTLRVTVPSRSGVYVFSVGIFADHRLEIDIPRNWFGDMSLSTSSGAQTLEHGFSWRSATLSSSSGGVRLLGPLTLEGNASLSASSGSVRIQDLTAASATLKTSSGTLSVSGRLTLTGNLDANTSSGSLRLNDTSASRVSAETSSGTLELGDMRADNVRGKTTSGTLRATRIEAASFDLETSSGGIRADALTGGGRLKSTSGNINVETLRPTSDVSLRASSGGVKLWVPDDYAFVFEGRCSSGSIRSDYDLYYQGRNNNSATYTHREGGPTISVETTSGSIRLSR